MAGRGTEIEPIPLAVLAGGDSRPSTLPETGAELHPLKGPKGLALKIEGRPIIDILIERLQASGYFSPIFIAGPVQLYGEERLGCTVIDTNSTFGDNIKAAVETIMVRYPGKSVAITTCDILPEVDELHRLMADYFSHLPLDFWFPAILAPDEKRDLGASSWKPRYRATPMPGAEPRTLLPGHLLVADPAAVRRPLIYRTFDLAYQSRNRPILYRLGLIVGHIFGGLVLQDLKLLLTFRLPTMTFTVTYNGTAMALRLRRGVITPEEMADRLHRIFVRYRHRRQHPDRKGRTPLKHGLSLAKDIDTVEEAEEIAQEFRTLSS